MTFKGFYNVFVLILYSSTDVGYIEDGLVHILGFNYVFLKPVVVCIQLKEMMSILTN